MLWHCWLNDWEGRLLTCNNYSAAVVCLIKYWNWLHSTQLVCLICFEIQYVLKLQNVWFCLMLWFHNEHGYMCQRAGSFQVLLDRERLRYSEWIVYASVCSLSFLVHWFDNEKGIWPVHNLLYCTCSKLGVSFMFVTFPSVCAVVCVVRLCMLITVITAEYSWTDWGTL